MKVYHHGCYFIGMNGYLMTIYSKFYVLLAKFSFVQLKFARFYVLANFNCTKHLCLVISVALRH